MIRLDATTDKGSVSLEIEPMPDYSYPPEVFSTWVDAVHSLIVHSGETHAHTEEGVIQTDFAEEFKEFLEGEGKEGGSGG